MGSSSVEAHIEQLKMLFSGEMKYRLTLLGLEEMGILEFQPIDLIGKEELLEVESRIERILGKIPAVDLHLKETVIDQDLTEAAGEAEDEEDCM